MRVFQYTSDKAQTVENLLREKGYSGGVLTVLRKELGSILCNGEPVFTTRKLNPGDELTVRLVEPGMPPEIPAVQIPLKVTYEDEDVLVLEKQPGLAVMPIRGHFGRSLFSALKQKYGDSFCPHVVTRLDRDTSGLMLIAKHGLAHGILNRDLKACVTREYLAVVQGRLTGEGTVNAPIAQCATGMKREVRAGGQTAVTHYAVVRALGENTLVRLRLETGRTHQIRVHMSYLGHPLAGDKLYGGDPAFGVMKLHSCLLAFTHPMTGEPMRFVSDPLGFNPACFEK